MPFINSKVSVPMTKEQKENIKTKLGEAISIIPGKSENWLMVGFEDSYELYFKGNQEEPTAFVEVKVYGGASASAYNQMTEAISTILSKEIGIPQSRIYIEYQETAHWGWNGANF